MPAMVVRALVTHDARVPFPSKPRPTPEREESRSAGVPAGDATFVT
jgi:hypothetical protein